MIEFEKKQQIKSGEINAYQIRANHTFPAQNLVSGGLEPTTYDTEFLLLENSKTKEKEWYRKYKEYYLPANEEWINEIHSKIPVALEMVEPERLASNELAYNSSISGFHMSQYIKHYGAKRVSLSTKRYDTGLGLMKIEADHICRKELELSKPQAGSRLTQAEKDCFKLFNEYGFKTAGQSFLLGLSKKEQERLDIDRIRDELDQVGISNFKEQIYSNSYHYLNKGIRDNVLLDLFIDPLVNKNKIKSLFEFKDIVDELTERTRKKINLPPSPTINLESFDEVNKELSNHLSNDEFIDYLKRSDNKSIEISLGGSGFVFKQDINDLKKEYELEKVGLVFSDYHASGDRDLTVRVIKGNNTNNPYEDGVYKLSIDEDTIISEINKELESGNVLSDDGMMVYVNGASVFVEGDDSRFVENLSEKLKDVELMIGFDDIPESATTAEDIIYESDSVDNLRKVIADMAHDLLVKNKKERKLTGGYKPKK